ncbi:MAG: tRNA 4-thiouridine(8) synthase ThiI [Calditrichaeota bacterium]|nr:MAG: tRNA 4-thiouridine(8) synthase ThiI [Calditrichota bacterium]
MKKFKNCIVIHYGEIALKGENRSYFEGRLKRNIKRALSGIPTHEFERLHGRMLVFLPDDFSQEQVIERLQKVFGITHFSFALALEKEIEKIKEAAWTLMQNQSFDSFKIETRRAQKEFPMTSVEVNREVGAYVQKRCNKRVDLTNPEVTCYIEISGPYALVYVEKIPGLRGLPVGVSERAVSLLSSGIDSPVASYLMLKRGVDLIYVHFHSQPYTNRASQENAERLVKILNQYQFRSKIYFVPFIDIQRQIMAQAPAELRVLLYRRYMVRLAEQIAHREKATALVTGESVGQVASQTLSNMRVVEEVTKLPVLRPLAGFDKEEIIKKAKAIGTFEISIAPYEDCCSLFVPQKPATKAKPEQLQEAESRLTMDDLLEKALQNAEIKILTYPESKKLEEHSHA